MRAWHSIAPPMARYRLIAAAALVGLAAGGCPAPDDGSGSGGSSRTIGDTTSAVTPTASAGADQTVRTGDAVVLDASASSDPRGRSLAYRWEQIGGTPVGLSTPTAAKAGFVAPALTGDDALTFRVTVTNADTRSASDDVVVVVTAGGPVADAGPDQVVVSGAQVNLDGSASTNPGAGALRYRWQQVGGTSVTLLHVLNPTGVPDPLAQKPDPARLADPYFIAPPVAAAATLEFELVVEDESGAGASDRVVITVTPAPSDAPVADAGPDVTVDEGSEVTLNGAGSAGRQLTYAWRQAGGDAVALSGADSAQATFTAPLVSDDGAFTFELTVTDDRGLRAVDTVVVTVHDLNIPPIAAAGPDLVANERTTVVLNATGSADPDGSALTYVWTQAGGPAVVVRDAGSAIANVTAPSVLSTTELTFRVRVTDAGGRSATDDVIVTVADVDASRPPALALESTQWQTSFRQGAVVGGSAFRLRNAGGGRLRYTLTKDATGDGAWLVVGVNQGDSLGESDTIPLTLKPELMPAGDYSATITISADPGTIGAPAEFGVQVTVLPVNPTQPTIQLGTTRVRAIGNGVGGSDAAPTGFLVANVGAGLVDFQLSSNKPWVQVPSSTTQTGETPDLVNLTFAGSGVLPRGRHEAIVTVSHPDATNGPLEVTVELVQDAQFDSEVTSDAFVAPRHLSTDASGYLYLADAGAHTVFKLDGNGAIVGSYGKGSGNGDGQLFQPFAAAVDREGNVYVADFGNSRVVVFNALGEYVRAWGSFGAGPGQFYGPVDIALDSKGFVYVADGKNSRVEKFTSDGTYVTQWLSVTSTGVDTSCAGLFVDSGDRVLVVTDEAVTEHSVDGVIQRVIAQNDASGLFRDVHVDDLGRIYTVSVHADVYVSRGHVASYSPISEPIASWSVNGSAAGQAGPCSGLGVDPSGGIWLVSENPTRLVRWRR